MNCKIRQEIEGDEQAIAKVVACAFEGKPYADDNDAKIVGALRDAGALVLSLVATHKGQIIGQVALSPATIGAGRYLCVGPLAVLPEHQRKGVGTALMSHALGVAQVYGRDGEPCRMCDQPIRQRRIGQRSSFFCPRCQR